MLYALLLDFCLSTQRIHAYLDCQSCPQRPRLLELVAFLDSTGLLGLVAFLHSTGLLGIVALSTQFRLTWASSNLATQLKNTWIISVALCVQRYMG